MISPPAKQAVPGGVDRREKGNIVMAESNTKSNEGDDNRTDSLDAFIAAFIAERERDFAEHGLSLDEHLTTEEATSYRNQWREQAERLYNLSDSRERANQGLRQYGSRSSRRQG